MGAYPYFILLITGRTTTVLLHSKVCRSFPPTIPITNHQATCYLHVEVNDNGTVSSGRVAASKQTGDMNSDSDDLSAPGSFYPLNPFSYPLPSSYKFDLASLYFNSDFPEDNASSSCSLDTAEGPPLLEAESQETLKVLCSLFVLISYLTQTCIPSASQLATRRPLLPLMTTPTC